MLQENTINKTEEEEKIENIQDLNIQEEMIINSIMSWKL